jgi:hypothetical protein
MAKAEEGTSQLEWQHPSVDLPDAVMVIELRHAPSWLRDQCNFAGGDEDYLILWREHCRSNDVISRCEDWDTSGGEYVEVTINGEMWHGLVTCHA